MIIEWREYSITMEDNMEMMSLQQVSVGVELKQGNKNIIIKLENELGDGSSTMPIGLADRDRKIIEADVPPFIFFWV